MILSFPVFCTSLRASLSGLVVKNPPANAGDIRDGDLIPGSGRSCGEGNDNPLQYSCWEIPQTEEPEGYSLWSCKRVRHYLATKQQCCLKVL